MCLSCTNTLMLSTSFGVLHTNSRCAFQLLLPPPMCWAVCLVLPTFYVTPFLQPRRQRECSYEQMKTARCKGLSTGLATLHRLVTMLSLSSFDPTPQRNKQSRWDPSSCLIPELMSHLPSQLPGRVSSLLGSPSLSGQLKDYSGPKWVSQQALSPPATCK